MIPYQIAEPFDPADYVYPRFSDEEYARRHKKAREFMAQRNLDCLLITGGGVAWDRCWSNIVYMTNFVGTMELTGYLVFPMKGDPIISILRLNATLPDRAARCLFGGVRGSADYANVAADYIKEIGLEKARFGVVELDGKFGIPANHRDIFETELPDAEFVSVTLDWWRMRAEKSQEEIKALEQAAHWGDLAHETLKETIRPGITERALHCAVYNRIYTEGADHPSMVLIASGPMSRPHTSFQRNRPVERTLEQGDMVIAELGPRTPTGYEAQVGRTFALGPPTQLYKDMWDLTVTAEAAIADVLRPGNTEMDVFEAGSIIRNTKYIYVSPLMHGMYGIPSDAPRVFHERAPETRNPFVAHQLVDIEAHIATPDRKIGVFMCNPYLVMPNGPPRCLSHYPREIIVV